MFGFGGFGTGKSPLPNVYHEAKSPKPPPKPQGVGQSPSIESLEPAIDGPPSPERIRAYTEQMKRSSIFGNNSRSNTLSSGASSSRSHGSITASTDNLALSRKSSARSTASSMPSARIDRRESVQVFGRSLFSRRGRKGPKGGKEATGDSLSPGTSVYGFREENLASPRLGTPASLSSRLLLPEEHRSRYLISRPYDFQHVTHTGQNHLPNLEHASQRELLTEFSSIRASQAPLKGELKGIRAEDLYFENFSSEALSSPDSFGDVSPDTQSKDRRPRTVPRKSIQPSQPHRPLAYVKSHDNFRSPPPPRPPRSPLSPTCPISLPARTSSRTASVLFDTFDLLATTTLDRPHTNAGFRRPAPFAPISPPAQRSPQETPVTDLITSYAASRTPTDEAWPLTATFGGAELADVQEEDEEAIKRRSRMSTASGELRMSQSVPALRLRSLAQTGDSDAPTTMAILHRTTAFRPPLSPGFQSLDDSWDNAIDYAYDHEAEADCDYQWDCCSVDDDNITTIAEVPPTVVEQPVLDLHLDDEHTAYQGRFRPSLLVPLPFDTPELSPMSNASTISDPRTPSNFLRPHHIRSPSHASSFKESHGFHLSPSLLIPSDFQWQMEQETLCKDDHNEQHMATDFLAQEPYHQSDSPHSPLDESLSSTASYRSSDFSRGSARSSSSTRLSHANSRSSQDSILLLGGAAGIDQAHRSIGSASSLPDLIPSSLRKVEHVSDTDLSQSLGDLHLHESTYDSAPAPTPDVVGEPIGLSLQHFRNQSLRKGINHFAPSPVVQAETETVNLSPVAESFVDSPLMAGLSHGRKVSAPVQGATPKEFKGRARSATATSGAAGAPVRKVRTSYMLFPHV